MDELSGMQGSREKFNLQLCFTEPEKGNDSSLRQTTSVETISAAIMIMAPPIQANTRAIQEMPVQSVSIYESIAPALHAPVPLFPGIRAPISWLLR